MALFTCVLVQLVQRADVDEQLVAAGEDEADGLLLLAADGDPLEAGELPDPVVHVDDEVAGREGLDVAERQAALRLPPLPRRRAVVAAEDLVVGVDGEAGRRHLEPLVERLDEEGGVGLAVDLSIAAEELEEAVGLGAAVAEDDGLGALGPEPREVLAE